MTDRELMQQALDALMYHLQHHENGCVYLDPITASLRERLAQPEKTNQCAETCERAKLCAVCTRGLTQPEPEPVAKYSDIISDGLLDPRNKFDTAPPRREWQGLTDEEIKDHWIHCMWKIEGTALPIPEFARAIEAKLKEKNNG